jgi:Uma2 family endonuclease
MTITESSRAALERRYEKAAEDYMASLPLEHFMESTPHAKQRKISWDSLGLLAEIRAAVHVFNELLVQYPIPRRRRPGQVVPDNMVVIHDGPIEADLSYNTPLVEPRPFWVLEYVSKNTTRKDYVDNKRRYERDLKVPYYLLFDQLKQNVTLYHHTAKRYEAVESNESGRLAIPELDLEMAIRDGWVRFWHQGKLLPLPAELQKDKDDLEREVSKLRKEVEKLRAKKNGSS